MNIPVLSLRFSPHIILMSLYLAGTGCVSNKPALQIVNDAEKEWILSGSALSPELVSDLDFPDEDVMGLTPEMKSFVDRAVSGEKRQGKKLEALLDAVISPEKLGLEYDSNATFTASETFYNKRANCLSFTMMIVSMLRHLGFRAQFNDVDVPPVWDLQNNKMLLLYRHINAMITRTDGGREIVDFYIDDYDIHYPQRLIEDNIAIAQYFSNRGMELLLQGNTVDAFRYILKAVDLAPEVPFIWVNLGSLYRNMGRVDEAEIAYRRALEIEPGYFVAISNIERVYRDMGRNDLAEEFARRARYFRHKNPYYLYKLAMDLFMAHDYESALKNIRTAIRQNSDEHRFHFLQGAIYKAMNKPERASASFNKAIELTSNQNQLDKYRRKIEKLL